MVRIVKEQCKISMVFSFIRCYLVVFVSKSAAFGNNVIKV